MIDAINVLEGVEGIRFCHFEDSDVVRHALVQRIVRAYESAKPQQQELPLGIGEGMSESIQVRAETREPRDAPSAMHPAKPQ